MLRVNIARSNSGLLEILFRSPGGLCWLSKELFLKKVSSVFSSLRGDLLSMTDLFLLLITRWKCEGNIEHTLVVDN